MSSPLQSPEVDLVLSEGRHLSSAGDKGPTSTTCWHKPSRSTNPDWAHSFADSIKESVGRGVVRRCHPAR